MCELGLSNLPPYHHTLFASFCTSLALLSLFLMFISLVGDVNEALSLSSQPVALLSVVVVVYVRDTSGTLLVDRSFSLPGCLDPLKRISFPCPHLIPL